MLLEEKKLTDIFPLFIFPTSFFLYATGFWGWVVFGNGWGSGVCKLDMFLGVAKLEWLSEVDLKKWFPR